MALNLTARIGLDGSGFQRGLKNVEGSVGSSAKRIAGMLAGAFSVGAIARGFVQMLKEGGRIRDMAAGIGLTTKEFQSFEYAAEQSGGSIENVTKAIKKIAQTQADALRGQKEYVQAYESLNMSIDDLRKKSPKEIFLALSSAVERGELGVQNMAGFLDVLGRNTDAVLPAMQAGFAKAAKEAEDLGLIIKDDIVDRLALLNDQLTTLQYKWKNVKAEMAISGMGAGSTAWENLQTSFNWISTFIEGLTDNPTGATTVRDQWRDAINRANASAMAAQEAAIFEEDQAREAANKRIEAMKKRAQEAQGLTVIEEIAQAAVKPATKLATPGAGFKAPSDALARIGGFTSAAGASRAQNAVVRTADAVEKIEKKIDRGFDMVGRSGW